MITQLSQADKEMAEMFRVPWEVTAGRKCDWPNAGVPDHLENEIWARWSLDYMSGRQTSMGGTGGRKFGKVGMVYITIFTPLGGGLAQARDAAQIAIDAYEGKRTPSDVWFRNVGIESEGKGRGSGGNKSWWTQLVVAMFTYEHLR